MNLIVITLAGLVLAAGIVAYLLGRKRVIILCCAIAAVAAIAWIGDKVYWLTHPQPERPVELTLTLARPVWKINERPWYLLTIKNVGYKDVTIQDTFWGDQTYLEGNTQLKYDTYFEVIDPDGHRKKYAWETGIHGEFQFWANNCGGKICDYDNKSHFFYAKLKHGEVLTATPSAVAPYRPPEGSMLVDARTPPRADKKEQDAYKRLRTVHNDEMKIMSGASHFSAYDPPTEPLYKGYRVLEGYPFRKPGRYRIRAVYVPITPALAEKDIRSGRSEYTGLGGLPPETRVYRYESNEVVFEVKP